MKKVFAEGPVSDAMTKVSEVIAILHDLIEEEFYSAPDSLKLKATDALVSSKVLMTGLLEHMKGHSIKSEYNLITDLEDRGLFIKADLVRNIIGKT